MSDATAELVISGARDLTGAAVDVATRAGRIAAVAPAGALAGAQEGAQEGARRIQADGLWILPAFCDSHVHLLAGGVALDQLNLGDVHDAAAFGRALGGYRAARPGDGFLCAYAANYDLLGPGTRPDRHALDRVEADRPLFILATDLHAAWANTAALRLAGLMEAVPKLAGAEVVTDASGLPTGELREGAAMQIVRALTPSGGREGMAIAGFEPPPMTPTQQAEDSAFLARAMAECARQGIGAVHNMDGTLAEAALLIDMAKAGALPIRVSLPMTIRPEDDDARISALLDMAAHPPVGKLRFGRVKMFMDGVFDTWTAFRTDDYPDRPGFRGEALFTAERFNEICALADARGLTIATHAVGDGAVRRVIDGYEYAIRANGPRGARHRIEHIDMLHPDDLPRLKALGILASMQPVHPPGSSGLPLEPTVSIMGRARWGDAFAWARIAGAGVPLAFGTDWPVSPLSPMNAIHAALARQPWAAGVADQRLPFEAVIDAYTRGGAFALGDEADRGALIPGMAADLTLIAGDPRGLALDADACRAVATVVGGTIVYEDLP